MDNIPIVILTVLIAITCGLALWFGISLIVARLVGRMAATGEHQRQMDVLHQRVREDTSIRAGMKSESSDSPSAEV